MISNYWYNTNPRLSARGLVPFWAGDYAKINYTILNSTIRMNIRGQLPACNVRSYAVEKSKLALYRATSHANSCGPHDLEALRLHHIQVSKPGTHTWQRTVLQHWTSIDLRSCHRQRYTQILLLDSGAWKVEQWVVLGNGWSNRLVPTHTKYTNYAVFYIGICNIFARFLIKYAVPTFPQHTEHQRHGIQPLLKPDFSATPPRMRMPRPPQYLRV